MINFINNTVGTSMQAYAVSVQDKLDEFSDNAEIEIQGIKAELQAEI